MSEIQGKPVYGVCACKEKRQVLSVDQAVDLIQQMAENNWQVPDGYLPKTTVNGIVEQNTKSELELWVGIQADWDALTTAEQANKFAIITDDATLQEIETRLNNLTATTESHSSLLSQITSGVVVVPEATHAVNADVAEEAKNAVHCSDGTFTNLTYSANDGHLKLGESNTFIEHKQLIHYGAISNKYADSEYSDIEISIPENVTIQDGDVLEIELKSGLTGDFYRRFSIVYSKSLVPYTIVFHTTAGMQTELKDTPCFVTIEIYGAKIFISNVQYLSNSSTNNINATLLRITKIVGAAV